MFPRAVLALFTISLVWPATEPAARAQERELPAALAPFEFLIGRWKGQGVPRDNPSQRFRGWTETHTWAWVFSQGKPVGLSLSVQGGKVFSEGTLRYEPARKGYIFDAREPGDHPRALHFTGTLNPSGKLLILERTEKGATHRLTLRTTATTFATRSSPTARTPAPRSSSRSSRLASRRRASRSRPGPRPSISRAAS